MSAGIPSVSQVIGWSETLTRAGIHAGIAIGIALALHLAVFALLDRMARLSVSTSDELVFDRLRQPLRWAMVAVAVSLAAEGDALIARVWDLAARFIEPALLGWVLFALVKAFAQVLDAHADKSDDVMAARSRRTRVAIFSRTLGFAIVFVTVALMLLGIPGVRNVGATLMASAGLATLAVGAAAQASHSRQAARPVHLRGCHVRRG